MVSLFPRVHNSPIHIRCIILVVLTCIAPAAFGERKGTGDESVWVYPFLPDEREAIEHRLKLLEHKLEALSHPRNISSSAPPQSGASPDNPSHQQNMEHGPGTYSSSRKQGERPKPATSNDKVRRSPENSKPGQFEVDEEAARRALERTLVQTGALLLKPGDVELATSLSYDRNQLNAPVSFQRGDQSFLALDEFRTNTVDLALQFRFGLPFDSQLELGAPYRYVDQSVVTRIGFEEAAASNQHGKGRGDLTVALAKTLLREKGSWPDVVLRLGWDSSDGKKSDGDVSLGGFGSNEYSASFSLTKRQDPLVFTGNIRYLHSEQNDGIRPGDSIALSIGTLLAASPETSLRLAFNQTFISTTEIDEKEIDGSEQVVSSLVLGASSIIGRRSFLNVSVAAGLTDDATDYSMSVAYTRRFIGLLAFFR